ncbi:unnamed protein product [Effrenium voratum]|nr:unnamed protein product [Effrenium voratum]
MAGLVAGEPEKQFEWHETYRDFAKNMYRTSYSDMSRHREVHVKSDLPSGFGGHVPSVRHDILFRNTQFDKAQETLRNDPNREMHGLLSRTTLPASPPPPSSLVAHAARRAWGWSHTMGPLPC